MATVREAEETEFADFFASTWARLFRTTFAVAGDAGHAEDALQSAFAKAYATWHRVRSTDHPEAYVRRMAVNEVLRARRRAWWRAERSGTPPEAAPLSAGRSSTEDDFANRVEVWEALMSLAPRQRAVLVLRYYEDLSEQEIADVLNCSRGTVKSQASDALSALRRRHTPATSNERSLSWDSRTS